MSDDIILIRVKRAERLAEDRRLEIEAARKELEYKNEALSGLLSRARSDAEGAIAHLGLCHGHVG